MAKGNVGKKHPHQETVKAILKKQGISYEEWAKKIVDEVCVSLLRNENVEWRNQILENASIDLISSFVLELEATSASSGVSSVGSAGFPDGITAN